METGPRGFFERTSKYLKEFGLSVEGKRVLVGGAGTLGSRIVRNLARYDFSEIYVIDFDEVGPENVGYQCFHTDEIGHNKAVSLTSRLQEFHPWTKLIGIDLEVPTPSGLWNEKAFREVEELVKKVDAVVTSFDAVAPRAVLLALSVKYGKAFVNVGIGSFRGYVKVLKENYCPICEKIREEDTTYYTNPNLAEMVAAIASQAVIFVLNGLEWPSEVDVNVNAPFSMVSSSNVENEGCPLCSEEVKELEEPGKFLKYLIEKIY